IHDVGLRGEGTDAHDIERVWREDRDVVLGRSRAGQRQEAKRRHAGNDACPLYEPRQGDAKTFQAFVVHADPADRHQSDPDHAHSRPLVTGQYATSAPDEIRNAEATYGTAPQLARSPTVEKSAADFDTGVEYRRHDSSIAGAAR